jgi:DNA polymerase-3 subunit gamma/tau
MGKALYRKYRSKSLSEIVGQEHITSTLQNALQSGKVSHAYLFTGPRGTGKTSIARILAHEINQLPYTDDSIHMDIIEIDAASNRRIDEIRDLRERVHAAPTSAKYKVYIIDEVHMLTKEAFNALLKTLEEPPAHVIFILATTEAHKLPETIISRTQRYTFKPIEPAKVIAHLRYIADQEKVDISDEALALVAQAGGGSFRDSISLLDQVSNSAATIDADAVRQALGIAPEEALSQIVTALESHSTQAVIQALIALKQTGYQSGQLAKQLVQKLRAELIAGKGTPQMMVLLSDLIEVPLSHDIDTKLELALITYALSGAPQSVAIITATEPTPAAAPIQTDPVATKEPTPEPKQQPAIKPVAPPAAEAPAPSEIAQASSAPQPTGDPLQEADFAKLWDGVLQVVKQRYNTLYGIIRMAQPTMVGSEITLGFQFAFHQKRVNEVRNKQIIMDIIKEVSGQNYALNCTAIKGKPAPASHATPTEPQSSPLNTISDIFGDAEVLDS